MNGEMKMVRFYRFWFRFHIRRTLNESHYGDMVNEVDIARMKKNTKQAVEDIQKRCDVFIDANTERFK